MRGILLKNLLSKEDAICLLELIQKSLFCTKEDEIKELISTLKWLVPYDFATCVFAEADSDRKTINSSAANILNINYPAEWLELYTTRKYHLIDPIFKVNFSEFKLQYWDDTYKLITPPKDFLFLARDFGLKKGYTYGLRNFNGTAGSLFSISGNLEHHQRTEIILTHIIPHFHQAITRIIRQNCKRNIFLSPREKEVLNWIKAGKSSWDISVLLDISERTVNFHINTIMRKLDVVNRPHAVAVAIEQGLIDIA
ncbi:MAG: autoinducer binding domain-containing protein [bacterium]